MKISNLTSLIPAGIVVVLDQITKLWVRLNMPLGESHPILGADFFRLTHVQNTGVAFGLNAGSPIFLIAFGLIAVVIIIFLVLRSSQPGSLASSKTVRFSLALILGGALGNLTDRLLFGRVTDFLDFDFPDFIMPRWPVFNIADSAVTIGVALWCIYIVFFSHKKPAPPGNTDSFNVPS